MAALSADTNRRSKGEITRQVYPLAAGAKIYAGAGVCLNASGFAVPASQTANLRTVGVADEMADNTSGAAGDVWVLVRRGAFKFATSGVTAATGDCTWIDDNTVGLAAGTDPDIVAGEILEVASDGEVWVYVTGVR